MSEKSKSSASTYGIGFTGIISAILVALKLVGIIQCSWLFVFMPLLIGIGLKLLILLVVCLLFLKDWSANR